MPPVERRIITEAEMALEQPLVSRHRMGSETVNIADRDIRLGAIALTEPGETDTITHDEKVRLQLLYNLETFIDDKQVGLAGSLLRDHQRDVFHDVYEFLATPNPDESGKHITSGYIQLPTGTGKTAIFSTLVDVLNKPLPNQNERLKALVLVPKLDLVYQTIGRDGQRGFAQFGQDTTVSEYTMYDKDLSGDAVVMTYNSLNNAVRSGRIDKDTFDFIICDEAHRALGENTSKALAKVSEDKVVVGVTATPNFANKKLSDVFPEKIHSMELREAIELGILSPVQCYALASDTTIETLRSGEDFTDKELESLIENEWRNIKATEFVKGFVGQGRQGIVSCVPGQEVKHARDMAERIGKEFVQDDKTGEFRRIRAVAVAGTTLDRADIYEAFERGEIDVLTYVDVLTEGWDSEKAKFMVNLRPTTSPVTAVQRLGRILRKSDPAQTATVIEFVDKTDKPLYTFFHALGEQTIDQGLIHGGQSGNGNGGGNGGGRGEKPDLPDDIIELLKSIDHIELAKLLVMQREVDGPPEGYLSVNAVSNMLGLSPTTVLKYVELNNIPMEEHMYGGYASRGLSPEAQESFLALDFLQVPRATEDTLSIDRFAKLTGTVPVTIKRLIERHGVPVLYRRFGGNIAQSVGPEEQEFLRSLPELQIQRAPDGVLSLQVFAKTNNTKATKVIEILEAEGLAYKDYKFGGRIAAGIDTDVQEIIKQRLQERVAALTPPEGYVSLFAFTKAIPMNTRTARKIMEEYGIESTVHSYQNKPGESISPEAQERLLEIITSPEYKSHRSKKV